MTDKQEGTSTKAMMDLDQPDAAAATQVPAVTIKTLTDRRIKVDLVDGITTIGHVRAVLGEKEGPAVAAHNLILNGRILDDQDETLSGLFAEDCEERVLHLFYFEPVALLVDPIDLAADWDAKNRLRVFKGVYCLSRRQFAEGSDLLCDALPTFAEPSFIPFRDCVRYAVIAGALTFDRPMLLKKVIKSPEVLEVIAEIAPCEQLVSSLYNCQYQDFFKALASLEQLLKQDWLLAEHASFLVKEFRIKAYKQILSAYRSLQLAHMAASFGVTVDFVDRELSRFIASGRLNCTIDRVGGTVESFPVDPKQSQHRLLLREGDALFNKVQRLGRLVGH